MKQPTTHRLGEALVATGQLDPDHLRIALQAQSQTRKRLGSLLASLDFSDEKSIWDALAAQYALPRFDPQQDIPSSAALACMPPDEITRLGVLPIAFSENPRSLRIACTGEGLQGLRATLQQCLPDIGKLDFVLASEGEIETALRRHAGPRLSIEHLLPALEQRGQNPLTLDDAPAVQLLDAILNDATHRGASDIHLEPEQASLRIRYRIDGILHPIRILNKTAWPMLCGRIKVMSGMNIAETRAPQDGHIGQRIGGRMIDFRVASQPTLHGENIVIRLLDRHKGIVPLTKLGLRPDLLNTLRRMMQRPEGLLLVAGPTGCGKTTTLYSMLSALNRPQVHIMTLEDPVEYPIRLIRQTSLSDSIKLEFASGVRSILRQDPDILLIGEIRDADTASMALRAALTGHQVHATLHASNAFGALYRLRELGIPLTHLQGNLIGILAQRLLRQLCPHCKRPQPADAETQQRFGDGEIFMAVGCPACGGQGYLGRMAIAEVLRIDPALDDLLAANASPRQLRECASRHGFTTLLHDGLERVRSGDTSLAELARVLDLDGPL